MERTEASSVGHCEGGNMAMGSSSVCSLEKVAPPSVLRLKAMFFCPPQSLHEYLAFMQCMDEGNARGGWGSRQDPLGWWSRQRTGWAGLLCSDPLGCWSRQRMVLQCTRAGRAGRAARRIQPFQRARVCYRRHSAKTSSVLFSVWIPGMRKALQPPSPREKTGVMVTAPGAGEDGDGDAHPRNKHSHAAAASNIRATAMLCWSGHQDRTPSCCRALAPPEAEATQLCGVYRARYQASGIKLPLESSAIIVVQFEQHELGPGCTNQG